MNMKKSHIMNECLGLGITKKMQHRKQITFSNAKSRRYDATLWVEIVFFVARVSQSTMVDFSSLVSHFKPFIYFRLPTNTCHQAQKYYCPRTVMNGAGVFCRNSVNAQFLLAQRRGETRKTCKININFLLLLVCSMRRFQPLAHNKWILLYETKWVYTIHITHIWMTCFFLVSRESYKIPREIYSVSHICCDFPSVCAPSIYNIHSNVQISVKVSY